jgi:1,3-beta-glucanosyltransferase GAS5
MTNVYSGGLAYEYSEEGNGYGMVKINSNSVTELPNFDDFKEQLANNPVPSGSGGASSTQATSTCPTADANWNVTSDALPAIPDAAAAVSLATI